MSKLVLSKLALFVRHDGICGSFHNKATINAFTLLCVLWQNLDEDSFDMLYKNYCWAAILDPIWTTNVPYKRKINMLSFTDNNFMICHFDFERFSIESQFPFFKLTLYIYSTVCYFLIFICFIMRPNIIIYGASYCEVCKNMVQISTSFTARYHVSSSNN